MRHLLCDNAIIRCVTLDVQFVREDDAIDQIRLFGDLLRALLVESKTLKTLRLQMWVTKCVLAAAGSVLPVATTLERLVISAADADDEDFVHQWHWLEFGLSHPLRSSVELPELMLSVDETCVDDAIVMKRLEAARRSIHPLQTVVCDAIAPITARQGVRRVAYEWYTAGTTTARVEAALTDAYLDPSLDGRPLLRVTEATELEAVVRIAQLGIVGVIAYGYGLCWIQERAVTIVCPSLRKRRSTRLARVTGVSLRDQANVQQGDPTPSGVPVVRWLDGPKILSLALVDLDNRSRRESDSLALILRCCPNLKTLFLELYGVRSLQTLVDAYANASRPCQIASLSVVARRTSEFGQGTDVLPLLKMLSIRSHPGTRVLRHLSLVTCNLPESMPLLFRARDVAQMLARNSVLETVHHGTRPREANGRQVERSEARVVGAVSRPSVEWLSVCSV